MKFLQTNTLPKLTITRRRRKMVINQVVGNIVVYENETTFELTFPSFFRGIRDAFNRLGDALTSLFLPRVYAC